MKSVFKVGNSVIVVDAIDEDGLPYVGMHGVITKLFSKGEDYDIQVDLGTEGECDFYEEELEIDEATV